MLEYWLWRNEIYLYKDDIDQKLKSEHNPLFIPNIPFFSPRRRLCEPEATIPLFHWLSNGKNYPLWDEIKAWSSLRAAGPAGRKLGQDFLLQDTPDIRSL